MARVNAEYTLRVLDDEEKGLNPSLRLIADELDRQAKAAFARMEALEGVPILKPRLKITASREDTDYFEVDVSWGGVEIIGGADDGVVASEPGDWHPNLSFDLDLLAIYRLFDSVATMDFRPFTSGVGDLHYFQGIIDGFKCLLTVRYRPAGS